MSTTQHIPLFFCDKTDYKFFKVLSKATLAWIFIGGLLFSNSASLAQPANDIEFTEAIVARSVRDTVEVLEEVYVYPEKARHVGAEMLQRLDAGKYSHILTRNQFVKVINSELRAISRDRHLSISTPSLDGKPTVEVSERHKNNFAFEAVEILSGNVGYLKFNKFQPYHGARIAADHALGFLLTTDALIIDLSENHGGSPNLVQYMLSYFLKPDTLLWSVIDRDGHEVSQSFSVTKIGHPNFKRYYPVIIITTARTSSGAEFFTYTLKHLGKAETVGQTTMGAAHFVEAGVINRYLNYWFSVQRPVNPITKTSWEGVGIAPDIVASPDNSIAIAHARAIKLLKK